MRAPAAALLALAAGACGDPVREQPGLRSIVAEGRVERGSRVVLRGVTASGDTLPPGSVAWAAGPDGAATLRGDTLLIARAGEVQVTASYRGARATRRLDAAVPPMIVFDMVVGGNRDVYRAALDGGDLARLTTHAAADLDPAAAGATVFFVSDRDGGGELYSVPAAGGAERRLTATAEDERSPAPSADGARLAFVRGTDASRVYVAGADASGARRPDPAHGHGGTVESTPAWSPDGGTLVFMSTAGGTPDLYRWTGAAASLLAGGPGGEFEPAYSPDGSRIAFVSTRTGDAELYVMRLASGQVARLTERGGSDGYPAWLPDGRLVYVAFDGTTPGLRWLDPDHPAVAHAIPLPGPASNPAALPR